MFAPIFRNDTATSFLYIYFNRIIPDLWLGIRLHIGIGFASYIVYFEAKFNLMDCCLEKRKQV